MSGRAHADALEARAERLKMARLLHVPDDEVAFLEQLPPDDVRVVRERLSQLVFAQGEGAFDNLLSASRLLPNALAASIAQRVFPPVITALVSGKLDGDRARALIGHVDTAYLADMAPHLDPANIADVVQALPNDVMVEVAQEINRRGDHVSAGRLVGVAPDRVIPDFLAAIEDERDLLQIAFFLEAKDRLDAIVRHVGDDRVLRILEAAHRERLWPEAMVLTGHLSPEETTRIAAVAADADEEVVTSLLTATHDERLWPTLLQLVRFMADADLPKVADIELLHRRAVVLAIIEGAAEVDEWETVVRVIAAMDDDARAAVLAHAAHVEDAHVEALVAAAEARGLGEVAAALAAG